MEYHIEKFNLPKDQLINVIDVVCIQNQLIILYPNHFDILDNQDLTNPISVDFANSKAVMLYTDYELLYCGFEDGTVNIYDLSNNFILIKQTSKKDAGGPGNKQVTGIYSSHHYLLVNTAESGLLIYLKPTFLFHKWIMIDGHTTISRFTINHGQLHVITKEGDTHLLDFHQQLLIPQSYGIKPIIDMIFFSNYLIVITRVRIAVIDSSNKIITGQIIEGRRLIGLARIPNALLVALNGDEILIIKIDQINQKIKINNSNISNMSINQFRKIRLLDGFFNHDQISIKINESSYQFCWIKDFIYKGIINY